MKLKTLAIVALTLTLTSLPAYAHSGHQLDQWVEGWRVEYSPGGFTLEEVSIFTEMMERHPEYLRSLQAPHLPTPPPRPSTQSKQPSTSSSRTWEGGVEQWRGLVSVYFPANQVDHALCIIRYESNGNPNAKNPRSSARGLFQILGSLWAPYFGVSYEDLYNPELNTRLAREIYDIQGWGAWSANRRC